MKRFTKESFVSMPWKNGAGITTELFIIPKEDGFSFRLSVAQVQEDAPFSNFPHINRSLIILNGKGCKLQFTGKTIELTTSSPAFFFSGEDKIFCELIEGSIQDFNVMIDKNWGQATTNRFNGGFIECKKDFLFIYDHLKLDLLLLEPNENLILEQGNYISIEVGKIISL